MSAFFLDGPMPGFGGARQVPTLRGRQYRCEAGLFSLGRLPTDSIGPAVVTFTGVHAGSEIRVYLPSGVEAAGVESCGDDHVLTWGAYPAGSANNTVTVRIVHPLYKIKEFQYTCTLGPQGLPVQQELDKWYSNP